MTSHRDGHHYHAAHLSPHPEKQLQAELCPQGPYCSPLKPSATPSAGSLRGLLASSGVPTHTSFSHNPSYLSSDLAELCGRVCLLMPLFPRGPVQEVAYLSCCFLGGPHTAVVDSLLSVSQRMLRRSSGTSKSIFTGTLFSARDPAQLAAPSLGMRASRPPLHRMCHLWHCSGTTAPGNCPHPSFGGITLPSTDIPAHGPDRDGSSWLGECLWPSPRTSFPGIPTKATTFAQSGVRTGSRGCPACLKPA